ncbi:PAS fold protein [Enhygromyxa salina]|uniref:PAS fold protein n=1 Tax=Enhygromyxa salina TaxID=215803 RepID=A0A2S9YI28_9BACT|nr:PAS domain-containing protein [Enhygromyxa salina]PRQ04764.1 PAS fold protein [Enhygromyxa salina]
MNEPDKTQPSDAERILGAIETVDEIIARDDEAATTLREVVRAFLDIFACDRAFLRFFKPVVRGGLCDPVVFTRCDDAADPELVFEEDDFILAVIATARDSDEVFACGPNAHAIPADSLAATKQGVRSLMIATVQPRLGPAWFMGIHDCERARTFAYEPRLLARLGVRMAEAVTRTVYMEHLDQGEARNRVLLRSTSEALLIIDVGTQRIVENNAHAARLFGWPPGQLLGVELAQLNPEQQPDGQRSDQRITELLAEVAAGAARAFEWTHRRADDALVRCGVNWVLLPSSDRLLVRASLRALG